MKPDWSRVYGARAGRGANGVRELIEIGDALAREQDHVMRTRLVEQYMPGVKQFGGAASVAAAEARNGAERQARASDDRLRAASLNSEETRSVAAAARAALARVSAADPRKALRLESPAERAARANRRRAEATADAARRGDAASNAGGWTILDGGVAAETSVTEKPEYDAFDDMEWGSLG